ncbi:hypothetical protein OROGR_024830 [Orobanche gracilis]
MMSNEEEKRCPLCAEEMDWTDQQFVPCKCGYEDEGQFFEFGGDQNVYADGHINWGTYLYYDELFVDNVLVDGQNPEILVQEDMFGFYGLPIENVAAPEAQNVGFLNLNAVELGEPLDLHVGPYDVQGQNAHNDEHVVGGQLENINNSGLLAPNILVGNNVDEGQFFEFGGNENVYADGHMN